MTEIKDFLKMLGEKLQPPDLEKIKYLLKDCLPGKMHNFIVSVFEYKNWSFGYSCFSWK